MIILSEEGNEEILGKPVGNDKELEKYICFKIWTSRGKKNSRRNNKRSNRGIKRIWR